MPEKKSWRKGSRGLKRLIGYREKGKLCAGRNLGTIEKVLKAWEEFFA